MSVSVGDVLKLECLKGAQVVAGAEGLKREVRWITVGEEPDLPEWVFGGELILSTLFAIEPSFRAEYIRKLSQRKVAGMMIKPKRFLGEIPEEVLKSAQKERFPIIEVPAEVLWSRVLAGFYHRSLTEQADRVRLETEMRLRGGFVDELLSGELSGEEIARRASFLGCDLSGESVVTVFDVKDFAGFIYRSGFEEAQVQDFKSYLYETVSGAVHQTHPNSFCVPRSDSILVILGSPLQERELMAKRVLARCEERLRDVAVHAGFGEPRNTPSELLDSYREAEAALRVGQRLQYSKDRIHSFSALGIQRLLFGLRKETPATLEEFEERTLGPLVRYDTAHGTKLVETLSSYIESNGNLSETACRLYAHRHTVRYRLKRIAELAGLDITRFEDAVQLYLAVKASQIT